jgi:hypothetical protein
MRRLPPLIKTHCTKLQPTPTTRGHEPLAR